MSNWTDRRHELDYDSAVAMRYHGRRKLFLDLLARIGPALSVVLGGAAFATVVSGHSKVAATAGLTVALISALDLAFNFSDRARLHESLFRRWGGIRAKLAPIDDQNEAALRELEVERAELDAESPWQLLALSVICENEEKKVRQSGNLYRVGWWQRTLANLLTLPGWQPIEKHAGTKCV